VPLFHFSFWQAVGRSTRSRGFVPGRSLLAVELRLDYGGGLCQLSGLIYYTSLMAGLEILERHPHSRDISDESDSLSGFGAFFWSLNTLTCLALV
jgi:vancomycin resistance protein VanW